MADDFNRAFAELQAAMADLDGDGVPDPVASVPPQQGGNAMAQMAQGQPGMVRFPIGRFGETEARPAPPDAGYQVPPSPAFAGVRNYFAGMGRDIVSDPYGAFVQGPLEFFGAGAGSHAMGTAARTATNPIQRGNAMRELRYGTEGGTRKNLADDHAMWAWRDAERAARETDLKDWAGLPPHTLQGRDPMTGRFGKIPDDVKALREKGRRTREIEKRLEKRREVDEEGNVWYRGMLDGDL